MKEKIKNPKKGIKVSYKPNINVDLNGRVIKNLCENKNRTISDFKKRYNIK